MQDISNFNIAGDTAAEAVDPRFKKGSLLRRLKTPIVLVFFGSVLTTICFWKVLPHRFRVNEQSDYFAVYEPAARNILAGKGYTIGNGDLVTVYPPGYSLLLAGVFSVSRWLTVSEGTGLSVLAVVCMALTSVFIFLLARLLWGTRPALLSSLIWMTYPLVLWLTKQANTELPFMVLFYGGLFLFWLALKRRLSVSVFFAVGLIFGSAMLIRPIALGIGLVLSAVLWWATRELPSRLRMLMIAGLLLGNMVAVIPWESWVYFKTGKAILLSTNGVKALLDGTTFGVETKGYRQNANLPTDVLQVMKDISERKEGITTFGGFVSVAYEELRSHPVGVIKLGLIKLGRSWYGNDSGRFEWPVLFIQLGYLVVVIIGARRAWKNGGLSRQFVVGTLAMVTYFWFMTLLGLSILRYMVPVIGLLLMMVGSSGQHKELKESQV